MGEEKSRRGPHKRCAGYWRQYDAKWRVFDKKAMRGLVEAVFGGLTTRKLDHMRFRRDDRVGKWATAAALSQKLQTYVRL